MKKSKLKKGLKEAFQEIARLDGQVQEIKRGVSFSFESKSSKDFYESPNEYGSFDRVDVKDLEVGKWYIDYKKPLRIVYVEKAHGNLHENNSIEGYGFDAIGKWNIYKPSGILAGSYGMGLATNEAVEAALIEEAKRRRLILGMYVNCLQLGDNVILKGDLEWNGDALVYVDTNDIYVIFQEGEWAEIVEEPKQEIDWSKPGLIVHGDDEGLPIVMLTGNHNVKKETFQAITLEGRAYNVSKDFKGEHWQRWNKNSFKLYTESITLKNE